MGNTTADSVACQNATETTIQPQGGLKERKLNEYDSTQKEITEISKKLKIGTIIKSKGRKNKAGKPRNRDRQDNTKASQLRKLT